MPEQETDHRETVDPFGADDGRTLGYNRVWFNLLRVQRSVAPRIARALRAEGLADPIWYEILLELERSGPDGIPMGNLERRLFTTQYGLSRHVQRIEAMGWLVRTPSRGRGRGQIVTLTDSGRGVHGRIWPVYEQAIRDTFASRLSMDEAYDLARILIKLYR